MPRATDGLIGISVYLTKDEHKLVQKLAERASVVVRYMKFLPAGNQAEGLRLTSRRSGVVMDREFRL